MKRTEELEGAISRRLAKYCEAGLSDDSLQQPIHHANDPASDSEIITFQEPEKSLHSESESTAPGKMIGAIPPRISVTRQEEGFILERLQKAEVEKLKGRQKTINLVFSVLLAINTSGLVYQLGKDHWGGRGPAASVKGSALEAQAIASHGQDGRTLAKIGEPEGTVSSELKDATGDAQARISLGGSDGQKFNLQNKDQKNLVERGGGRAASPVVENPEKALASTSLSNSVSAPENIVAPRYVGSRTSDKYHYPHCKWVNLIKSERLQSFSSVKEAQDNGNYVRCPTCQPPHADAIKTAESGDIK